jgi:predicted small secreted protein
MKVSLKQISAMATLVLLVLLAIACNTSTGNGSNVEQSPAPKVSAEEIAMEPPPAPNIREAATFDLKPGGCDMVCVLGAYLGLND